MTAPFSTCTVCGTQRDRVAWRALPLVGVQVLDEPNDEDGEIDRTVLELRNCPCGAIPATLSVKLIAPLAVINDVVGVGGDIDVLFCALADLQAELARSRQLFLRTHLAGARMALEALDGRPAKAAPHLSQIGRDPPGYAYLARAILERNDGDSLEVDLRHELRVAYADGRNAVRTERAEAELKIPRCWALYDQYACSLPDGHAGDHSHRTARGEVRFREDQARYEVSSEDSDEVRARKREDWWVHG